MLIPLGVLSAGAVLAGMIWYQPFFGSHEAVNRFFGAKGVGVLTNVPGPRTPMTLAGAPVAGVVGWAPTSMRQALTVTIFSYAGQVVIGFGTDCAVLRKVAHSLKSSAGNVGARRLAALLKDFESLGKDGRIDDARAGLAALRTEHARTLDAIHALIEEFGR